MRLLADGYVQLENDELPQLRNNRVGTSVEDVINKQAALITTTKRGQTPQTYVTKLEPVDINNNIYKVVAQDPLQSYAQSNLAGSVQGAFGNNNAWNRFAASVIQEGLMEEAGYPVDRNAAARSYGKNSAMGYETHHLNEIDTQMQILSSLSPEGQNEYIRQMVNRGYRLSDDPRNQIRAYGSSKNVPGYRSSAGKRMIPKAHIGHSEHHNIHDAIRKLAVGNGLPDARLTTGDNTIIKRMAGLPHESQKVAMGMALTEIGRLAAMKELAKPGSEKFSQRQNAENKQGMRVAHQLSKIVDPRMSSMPTREGLMRFKGLPL